MRRPLSLLALIVGITACDQTVPPPDRIFVNARIWTGDATNPEATALALRGDTIVAVGTDDSLRTLAGPATIVEDLGGRRMLPGFHDAHWHLPTRRTADLNGAEDVAELIARLEAFAEELPADAWITGRGWTPQRFPGRTPHRRYLDAAFPTRPVLLTDRDGHQVLANTAALQRAGITKDTPVPVGGAIVLDPDGTPTGLLQETAMPLVRNQLPAPTANEVYAALRYEMHRAAERGLTALQLAQGMSATEDSAIARALAEDSLLVRFRVGVPFSATVADSTLERYAALVRAQTGPLIRYGLAKGMLDGTIDAGTAGMLEPYSAGRRDLGLLRWDVDTLRMTIARYDRAGLQVALHAIGDRAIRIALDAYEQVQRAGGRRDARHRIEHLEVPHPTDLPRFKALGVIASTQAIFATPDATGLGNYLTMLGPDRADRPMPFRSLDDAGAIQPFGSDYPVFPMNPLWGIYTAVTRQLDDGTPFGGWNPEQRITLEAALRHYTADAAYAAFREQEIGVLKVGMLADFVVLSEEIFDVPSVVLMRATPVLTVMGGRETYRSTSLVSRTKSAPTTKVNVAMITGYQSPE
ncbi:MAG: amidohydrolase [Gemmatimonadaceae bacterium]